MAPTTEELVLFLASLGLTPEQTRGVQDRAALSQQYSEHTLAAIYPDAVDFPATAAYVESVKGNW
jgi:hypothetical protein